MAYYANIIIDISTGKLDQMCIRDSGTSGYADASNHKSAAAAVNTVTTVEGLSGNAVSIPGGGTNKGSIKLPEDLLIKDNAVQDDFTISMLSLIHI